jgi:phosphoribosylglycinamide formyltransferase-1
VKVRAERLNVPFRLFTKEELKDGTVLGWLQEAKVDYVILAGFLLQVPSAIIEAFPNRIINIHPALIPSFCGQGYYGLHVHEKVLERGVRVTGATVHFVDEGTDTGPIILQKPVMVEQGDTPEVLQRRVMEQAEWKIMPMAINLIAQGKVKVENRKVIIDGYDPMGL